MQESQNPESPFSFQSVIWLKKVEVFLVIVCHKDKNKKNLQNCLIMPGILEKRPARSSRGQYGWANSPTAIQQTPNTSQ